MSITVYRYGFQAYVGPQLIRTHRGAELLSVDVRDRHDWNIGHSHIITVDDYDPNIWARVNTDAPLVLRCIWVAETGMAIPEPVASTGKFIGAAHRQLPTGLWYSAHVFDYGIEVANDADREKVLAVMKDGVAPDGY